MTARRMMSIVDVAKLPPQAPELEQAVIGACLIDNSIIGELSGILEPTHFYVHANHSIWSMMMDMRRDGEAIDILTVTERAKAMGKLDEVGGAFYISQLTNKVSGTSNAEYHARIIQQKFIYRRLIELGDRLARIDESEDVFDTLDWANSMLADVNAVPCTKDPVTAADVMAKIADGRERELFITMGMGRLDEHIRMGPSCVTVIGARPSIGKTTFAINACMNMARDGHRVLFISLEMNERALVSKIGGILTGIDSERITMNEINDDERDRIASANVRHGAWLPRILIEDLSTLKASQVAGVIHRAVQRHDVSVVVLDYIQCVEGAGDSPVDRMSNISRACKSAAKSSGVRLIELSQLKRRDGAEEDPQMSDLREAGQIEADGDIILMLGRRKGEGELICKVEKNKVGPIGSQMIPFDLPTQRIGNSWNNERHPVYNPAAGIVGNPDTFTAPKRDTDDAPF